MIGRLLLPAYTARMSIDTIPPNLDGDGLRIGIVQARFNEFAGQALTAACVAELVALGVDEDDITHVTVPGALEVPLALSGHNATDLESRLCYQPGYAMRGGLSFDAALAAVTTTPARLVGVDARVGSIKAGKDADLVLWSGEPFQPTSKVIGVLVDGRLIVDPRQDASPAASNSNK